MPIKSKSRMMALNSRLKSKAVQGRTNYHVAAAAYSKLGNLLGISSNNVNTKLKKSKRGMGVHAERELMSRHGKKIRYIVLSRTNHRGDNLPIHPCETCAKMLARCGVKVILLHELLKT